MYEQLLALDDIRINFSAQGMHIVNIVLAFVMFGVALGIRPEMFKNVLQYPKSALVGFFCQVVGLPAMTFLLVISLNHWITPMVAMGMILVAACPGGNGDGYDFGCRLSWLKYFQFYVAVCKGKHRTCD